MKQIEISNRQHEVVAYALVDDEDFEHLSKFKWHLIKGYPARSQNGSKVYMAQEILGHVDGLEIDHRNRNSLDNQRGNLRRCTHSQNGKNKASSNGRRGLKKLPSLRWQAQIHVDGKDIYLGSFDTQNQAQEAYNQAAKTYYGEFAGD